MSESGKRKGQSKGQSEGKTRDKVKPMRGARAPRCPICQLGRCICAELPRVATQIDVAIYAHERDIMRPSNTARFLPKLLPTSRLFIWGREAPAIASNGRRLVLHPDGRALTADDHVAIAGPTCLIVPDGTWRHVRHMLHRAPELQDGELVSLPLRAEPSPLYLRRRQRPGEVCTLEAVARALGVLENPTSEQQLVDVLAVIVARMRERGRR